MKSAALFLLAALLFSPALAPAQQANKKKKKKSPPPFSWTNPLTDQQREFKKLPPTLKHATFNSPSMALDVGYFIYLPPEYEAKKNKKFPVVYHLHGGRPGSEAKSVQLSEFVDHAIANGDIQPTIYVFPNGGPMSWYNFPEKENGLGEDVFVNELIPHIDETYRTWGTPEGRAIEGFSQGGRGTTRIMFKHPELFGSAAPGGSGYEPEKRIQENDGWESDSTRFLPIGYNAWDLAKEFAKRKNKPDLPILLWVGTKGFNYEYNLKFSEYLDQLGVPHEIITVEGIDHSASRIYEKQGLDLMSFHDKNFAESGGNPSK
ncbi:MAG: alpha/beta hydrolase-fold protein [Verrucomicrobiota bacterium]